jgi:hypothetical protein
MDQIDLSVDILMKETLAMTELMRLEESSDVKIDSDSHLNQQSMDDDSLNEDYFFYLADEFAEEVIGEVAPVSAVYPENPGVIYKIDRSGSTFCVRGFIAESINEAMAELNSGSLEKRSVLRLAEADDASSLVCYFQTDSIERAQVIKDQIINRRFPLIEDSVCNISDPGFSWWMNIEDDEDGNAKFQIFFRSHGIFRTEKYIQLGPIGDGSVAALRLNQARSLFNGSFPISEFSCDDKCFTVATSKPDHLSFVSFIKIFLTGENYTDLENFPDTNTGRSLFYYFHELAIVRKFWIEVKTKLG